MAKRHTKNITHEYTSTKHLHNGYIFRVSNYLVLLSMIFIDKVFQFPFPEMGYILVICAVVGYDVEGIYNIVKNLIGKRK